MEEKGRIGEAKENMDGNGGMEEFEGGRAQKVVCRGRFKPKKFFTNQKDFYYVMVVFN